MKISLYNLSRSVGVPPPHPSELMGHEDNVGEKGLLPILNALGYDSNRDVKRKPTLRHPLLKGGWRQPDYGVLEYNKNKYGMVVSIKPYGERLTEELEGELCGWCALAGSLYGVLTNGDEVIIIKPIRGVVEWDELDKIPSKAQLETELGITIPKYSDYDLTYATRITEELTSQTINSIAEHCHNAIRSKKGKLIPERLYEFTKLVVMRIIDERRFRAKKQNELRMSTAFLEELEKRGVNVEEYMKNFFASIRDEIGIFDKDETLELGLDLIYSLINYLDTHSLWSEKVDVLGEIYERFLMRTMTGRELGDYFTPRPIIDAMVKMVNPSEDERVLDPACGTGGFLISSMRHVCRKEGKSMKEIAENFYGIDIFETVVKLCKINLWLHGNCHENVVRADSLDPNEAPDFLKDALIDPQSKGFDVILTNPPFGRKGGNEIPPEDLERLISRWKDLGVEMFECAYGRGGLRKIAPQSAFMELCIKALKPKGRLGIVIDNGLLSNPSKEDPAVREIIRRECIIDAVVGLPKGTFKPYGSNVYPAFIIMHRKENETERQGKIFRAEARKVGIQPARNIYVEDSYEDLEKICRIWEEYRNS